MSAAARYVPARGKLDSPIVRDTKDQRPVLVCLRKVGPDEAAPGGKADAAAMRMATICAQALNRADSEEAWLNKQRGKNRETKTHGGNL